MPTIQGTVIQPLSKNAYGSTPAAPCGNEGAPLFSELHGKYYAAAYGNGGQTNLFTGTFLAKTIAVLASATATVGLVNPAGSGVNLELAETALQFVTAATLAGYQWCIGTATGATLTTPGVVYGGIGNPVAASTNKGLWYTALTPVGTPLVWDLLGSSNSASALLAGALLVKPHDGKLLVPPGVILSLYMNTAAGPTTGTNGQVSWMEYPV